MLVSATLGALERSKKGFGRKEQGEGSSDESDDESTISSESQSQASSDEGDKEGEGEKGDNLAKAMYAIGTRKLIDILALDQLIKVWFTDDCSAAGKIDNIHEWFAKLKEEGALYGYFPKASK